MKRNIAVLVAILLVFPTIVHSITTFIINETEKISLAPNATDPDFDDELIITYNNPLNENGEWQTDYGDAGEYKTTITVSDGTTSVSEDILIIVKKKEEPPVIKSFTPEQNELSINEAESINFAILAKDFNGDELSYVWFLDGKEVRYGDVYSYISTYEDEGLHKVSVVISDMVSSIMKEWKVNVANVDVERLLDDIKDVTVNENEVVRLEIPDFEKYGLSYTISEPIGNDNEWKTTNEDQGSYQIKMHVEGKGFSKDKIVDVFVNDIDRTLVFENVGNKIVNEDEELKIILNAQDPDSDYVTFSANNLPEGAKLEENVFVWKPSYDTVRTEGFVDWIIDKFRLLSKNFYIQFSASSKDKKVLQNIIVTVKDVNRAPLIEDIGPITINEGATLKIVPNAYDLDGDKISLSYSGFINTNTFKSSFDDAGTYYTKVTASDGLLETSKFVQINIEETNREPVFGKIQDIKTREGDDIAILLNANDPDGDEVVYYMDNAPEGSSLKGNAFFWTPDYSLANKGETKKIDLVFVASDDKAEARQVAKIEIADKNRPPKIIDATKNIVANINEPVLLFVKATDDDGDDLTYTWSFGILEKYKATANHQRIFTSIGTKVVKVTVSDGIDEVEQIINVNVV